MKKSPSSVVSPALLAMVAPLLASQSSAAVIIDGFTTYQAVTASGPPAGFKSANSSTLAPEAIGGERDLYVERTSANSGTVAMEVASSGAGIASYSSGLRTSGNGLIVWDGVDGGPAVVPTGLGGLDLTQGGLNTAFRLSRTSDLGGFIRINVYEDASHISEALISVPADPTFTFLPVDVPFSSFAPIGSGGGANFANIGALSLFLNGGTAGTDMGVETFVAVPEASPILAATSLLGLAALGWIRRDQAARLKLVLKGR